MINLVLKNTEVRYKLIDVNLEEPETVEVIVNPGSRKKFRAILPPDHQRNIKNKLQKIEQEGQLEIYDANKVKPNVWFLK